MMMKHLLEDAFSSSPQKCVVECRYKTVGNKEKSI